MNSTFKPCLEILPKAQRKLWPQLKNAPLAGFTLYGGTAIALRLGHRESVDFDFFSSAPLDREKIKAAFPFIANSITIQDQENAWTLIVHASKNSKEPETIKISFFGNLPFGRVGNPDFTNDGVLLVASISDLMATKLKVVLQRAEAKDYRDIAAMLNAGISLSHGLSAARALYGPNFQPAESLKALTFFGDGDLKTLTKMEKKTLIQAVKKVNLIEKEDVDLKSASLSGETCLNGFQRKSEILNKRTKR